MKLKRARTYSAKPSEVEPTWHIFDAADRPLGRLAVEVARILQGKHKPTYTPHLLTGDFVIVVNASQTVTTGQKTDQKVYYRHSGYHGGLKTTPLKVMLDKHPVSIRRAIDRGELPPPTRLMGQRTWTKGAIVRHIEARLEAATRQAEIISKNRC